MYTSDFASTGSREMSRFQGLSAGKIGQPATSGLDAGASGTINTALMSYDSGERWQPILRHGVRQNAPELNTASRSFAPIFTKTNRPLWGRRDQAP